MQQQKQKFFYGWWVVLALMLVTGTSLALVVSTFNIYLNPVSEALGISKTQFALCSTIINLAVLVAAPKLGGWLQQNTRKVLLLCLFGFYAAYAAFAWVNSLAALYVVAAVFGLFSAGGAHQHLGQPLVCGAQRLGHEHCLIGQRLNRHGVGQIHFLLHSKSRLWRGLPNHSGL